MILRMLAIFALFGAGCGYRYHLPGHGPGKTAAVSLPAGRTVPALSEGIIVAKLGYQLSLASEDPEVADVVFLKEPPGANIAIIGKKPGRTVFHYGNFWNQTLPFGASESKRLGVPMPSAPHEDPGAGKGCKRRYWLRSQSDGAFVVEVTPPDTGESVEKSR